MFPHRALSCVKVNPKSLSRSPLLGAGRHVELTKPLRFADGTARNLRNLRRLLWFNLCFNLCFKCFKQNLKLKQWEWSLEYILFIAKCCNLHGLQFRERVKPRSWRVVQLELWYRASMMATMPTLSKSLMVQRRIHILTYPDYFVNLCNIARYSKRNWPS